jgi:hypothetical protein
MTAYRITIDIKCPDSWSTASVLRAARYAERLEIAVREHAEKYLDNHRPPLTGITARIDGFRIIDSLTAVWGKLLRKVEIKANRQLAARRRS